MPFNYLKSTILLAVGMMFVGFIGMTAWQNFELDRANVKIDKLETKAVANKAVTKATLFENNKSITFKYKKEKEYEEIPDTIGTHIIHITD